MSKFKFIRTANLDILKVWLLGGQINAIGDYDNEGVHDLTTTHFMENIGIIADGKFNKERLKEVVIILIDEFCDDPSNSKNQSFFYYNEYYKFKIPSEKKLNELVEWLAFKLKGNLPLKTAV